MSRLISVLLIAIALGSFEVPVALAETGATDGWQVLESHGGVRYRPVSDRHWWPARTGIEIPDGSTITTGSSGFLIIARTGESITLRTNSRVQLQGGPDGNTIQQTAGHLRYRITRAPGRRFGVETPYLSLMVKGTVFDVVVGDHGTEVEVTQGRVRVDTPSGQAAELDRGQSARIAESADAGLELRAAPESPFAAAPPAESSIPAAYPRDGDSTDRRHDVAGQNAGQVRVGTPRGRATGRIPAPSAPNLGSGGARQALRTPPTGAVEAAPTPSRPAAAGTPGQATLDMDGPRRDAAGQAAGSYQALPDVLGSGAGATLEITADGVRVDDTGPQVVELDPGQSALASGRESALALAPAPDRPIAAAETRDGQRSTDSPRRDAPDQAADRADKASAGGIGDRIAVASLVLVLLAAVVWWRRQRQRTARSTERGRWPWQRRAGTSSGAPSSAPASHSMGDGARRSTTNARP